MKFSYDDYEMLKVGYVLKKKLTPELVHHDYLALSLEEQRNVSNAFDCTRGNRY